MKLYENQIRSAAQSQVRASNVDESDVIARAVGVVGDNVLKSSIAIMDMQDNDMNQDMEAYKRKSLMELEQFDGDLEEQAALLEKQKIGYEELKSSFGYNTNSRYNDRFPKDQELYGLAATDITAKKTNQIIYQRMETKMDQWSSDVVNGVLSRKEVLDRIQNEDLKQTQKDALKYKLNSYVDDSSVHNAIIRGEWDTAERLLSNTSKTNTINAPRRSQYYAMLKEGRERSKASGTKSQDGKLLEKIYKEALYRGDTGAANSYANALMNHEPILLADGSVLRTDTIPADDAVDIMKTFKDAYDILPAGQEERMQKDNKKIKILTSYDNAKKAELKDTLELSQEARDLLNDRDYSRYLSTTERDKLFNIATEYSDVVQESLFGAADAGDMDKRVRYRSHTGMESSLSSNLTPQGTLRGFVQKDKLDPLQLENYEKYAITTDARKTFATATEVYEDRLPEGLKMGNGVRSRYATYLVAALAAADDETRAGIGLGNTNRTALADALQSYNTKLLKADQYNAKTSQEMIKEDFKGILTEITGMTPDDEYMKLPSVQALYKNVAAGITNSNGEVVGWWGSRGGYNVANKDKVYPQLHTPKGTWK